MDRQRDGRTDKIRVVSLPVYAPAFAGSLLHLPTKGWSGSVNQRRSALQLVQPHNNVIRCTEASKHDFYALINMWIETACVVRRRDAGAELSNGC